VTLDPQEEYDLYDIADLETGEASGLAHDPPEAEEHSERRERAEDGLWTRLRRLLGW
jgi:hypothetical protein